MSTRYSPSLRPVVVSFRSPIALDRFDWSYIARITGPLAPACRDGRHFARESRYLTTTGFERGDTIRLTVRSPQSHGRSTGWCPGKRYSVTVHHHAATYPGGRQRLVGRTSFIGQ